MGHSFPLHLPPQKLALAVELKKTTIPRTTRNIIFFIILRPSFKGITGFCAFLKRIPEAVLALWGVDPIKDIVFDWYSGKRGF